MRLPGYKRAVYLERIYPFGNDVSSSRIRKAYEAK